MVIEPHVITFFIRCPEVVAVPNGASQLIQLEPPLTGFENTVLHLAPDKTPFYSTEVAPTMFVSVRFHQGKREKSLFEISTGEMVSVLAPLMPDMGFEQLLENPFKGSDNITNYTIAELTTPIALPGEDGVFRPVQPDEGQEAECFERCLSALFMFLRAYRSSQNLRMHTPNRERLGPEIFSVVRSARFDPPEWDGKARWILNTFALPPSPPKMIDDEGVQRLQHSLLAYAYGHPMNPVIDIMQEARSSLSLGDYRASIMLSHTASEVFLDTALMLMQWEEGLTPEQASEVFQKSLVERVRNQYHPRLGGTWITKNGSACDVWRKDLVLVRHQVIHGGLGVTRPHAESAFRAHAKMYKHLEDRLASQVRKYPATAGIIVSRSGFAERNMSTRAVDRALATSTGENFSKFGAWRLRVLDLRATRP